MFHIKYIYKLCKKGNILGWLFVKDYDIINSCLKKWWRNTQVWLKGPVLKTGRSETARGFESLFLRHLIIYFIAEWSSPVARWAHNPKVVGSNPASATKVVPWCSGYHVCLSRRRSRVRISSEPPFYWFHSSVGRAKDWKSLCRWFDSTWNHH